MSDDESCFQGDDGSTDGGPLETVGALCQAQALINCPVSHMLGGGQFRLEVDFQLVQLLDAVGDDGVPVEARQAHVPLVVLAFELLLVAPFGDALVLTTHGSFLSVRSNGCCSKSDTAGALNVPCVGDIVVGPPVRAAGFWVLVLGFAFKGASLALARGVAPPSVLRTMGQRRRKG